MTLMVECVNAHDRCGYAIEPCPYCEVSWPPKDSDTGKFVKYKEQDDGEL